MTNSPTLNDSLMSLINRTDNPGDLPQPFARDILLLECHIAGTTWRDLSEVEHTLHAGDELTLCREPANEHDPLAIHVLTANGAHLGYIPRANNETLARLMDAGKLLFAKLTGKSWEERWLKINVQIVMREF